MLWAVEDAEAKKEAQGDLQRALYEMPFLGRQRVVFRPNFLDVDLYGYGDGRMYFGTRKMDDDDKYWNSFGFFDESRSRQQITIEINIPLENGQTEGFFAKDELGRLYLMHSGRPGGGKTGVSRNNFLTWLMPELVPVVSAVGPTRAGIVIGRLDASNLPDRIEHFVRQVRSFKDAVGAGDLDSPAFKQRASAWGEYRREFSGRKTGAISTDLSYVSFHGDVVDALKLWAEGRLESGAQATNSPLIDLLVHRAGKLIDVFEVKTNGARQTLYTAIGQLAVHCAGDLKVRQHLVLPEDVELPKDIGHALRTRGITVHRFRIQKGKRALIVG